MCIYSKEGNNQLYLTGQGRFTNIDTAAESRKISRSDPHNKIKKSIPSSKTDMSQINRYKTVNLSG